MTSTIRREPVRTVRGQHHAEADSSLQEYRLIILSIFVSPGLSNVEWQACAVEHSPALGSQAWFPLKPDFRKEISNHSFQLSLQSTRYALQACKSFGPQAHDDDVMAGALHA
jgi:hypothetical protein